MTFGRYLLAWFATCLAWALARAAGLPAWASTASADATDVAALTGMVVVALTSWIEGLVRR